MFLIIFGKLTELSNAFYKYNKPSIKTRKNIVI